MESETKYLNISQLDPEKVMIYTKWIESDDPGMKEERRKIRLQSADHTECHVYRGYNKFTKQTVPTPLADDGWTNTYDEIAKDYDDGKLDNETLETYTTRCIKSHQKWVRSHICDPTARLFCPNLIESTYPFDMDNFRIHKTLDNYAVGFVVFIKTDDSQVYVYGRTLDVIPSEYDTDDLIIFTRQIAVYEPVEIFIGKSNLNEMTEFSGGHGPKWDSNTILLRLKSESEDKFSYVIIGTDVREFCTSEQIISYNSSVGNNCVPYAYAESVNFVYCMSDMTKSVITDHPDRLYKGHVFHLNTATYESIPHSVIAERDSWNIKSPINCEEKTNCVKFNEVTSVSMVENTCADDTLCAARHVHTHLPESNSTYTLIGVIGCIAFFVMIKFLI